VNCNDEFKKHLEKAGIAYEDGSDLREKIASSNDASFLKGMIETLRVLLALRYNNGRKGNEEKDYILSPVADENGNFFNSLKADGSLPVDADANGAYHIAKKGLLLIKKIKEFDPEGNKKYPDLSLSNDEWFHSLWFRQ
jgi:CRISPR-associated protein Cpf1